HHRAARRPDLRLGPGPGGVEVPPDGRPARTSRPPVRRHRPPGGTDVLLRHRAAGGAGRAQRLADRGEPRRGAGGRRLLPRRDRQLRRARDARGHRQPARPPGARHARVHVGADRRGDRRHRRAHRRFRRRLAGLTAADLPPRLRAAARIGRRVTTRERFPLRGPGHPPAMQNVFVLGLTDWQRKELETVPLAGSLTFHDLLDEHTLVEADTYDLTGLLDRARTQLTDFDGTVDAIIAHWDFPTSVLAPVLAAERGIAAPSLASVLTFEHKYWSRLAQQQCVPDVVPGFAAFDPFADDPLAQIDLEFPFWIKPIKSHSSQLGFAIEDRAGFEAAITEIRAEIGRVGEAFDEALAMVDLPAEVAGIGGNHCLAEQIISGVQAAPEGSMFRGEFLVHGLVDMHREDDGPSFDRIDYPAATVPSRVQERMTAITEDLV